MNIDTHKLSLALFRIFPVYTAPHTHKLSLALLRKLLNWISISSRSEPPVSFHAYLRNDPVTPAPREGLAPKSVEVAPLPLAAAGSLAALAASAGASPASPLPRLLGGAPFPPAACTVCRFATLRKRERIKRTTRQQAPAR